ncbi:putative ATP-binding protein [Nannochloris sp. 'desiccata']|nr:hypothetical protein KSW81_000759 [Chlorella desiccata (nom. nud.)]KAH7620577.1 putative ATP-binding protein [Chlorella desiccata (nom. nud.)]
MQLQQGSNAPDVTPPQDSSFYNRLAEQAEFLTLFGDTPGLMTVLVGPPNCGKTAFLKYLVSQLRAKPDPPLILMIDSRLKAVTSPEEISKALCDAVVSESLMERAQSTAGAFAELLLSSTTVISTLGAEVGVQLENIKDYFAKDEDNLAETLEKLDTLFENLKQLPNQPVIIIDEANKLMRWHELDPSRPNLEILLSFLTAVTKQDNLAHVVLATSDYFLASWLYDHGLTNDKFKVEVLGDLTEQEAREFVYGTAMGATIAAAVADPGHATVPATEGTWRGIVNDPSKQGKVPPGAQEQWPAIYERCGGNIGLLKQCMAAARVKRNWKGALRGLTTGPYLTIKNAFTPIALTKRDVGPLWTGQQWELVLQEIVKAPHHAVLQEDLKKKLEETVPGAESGRGNNILMSMIKYNLLALRPPSDLARDLPQEVYGDDQLNMAVTLPLPVHVWAAKKLLERSPEGEDDSATNP